MLVAAIFEDFRGCRQALQSILLSMTAALQEEQKHL
jgi:hypothetical protein